MTKPRDRWRRILPIAIFVGSCHVPDAHAAALTFDSVVKESSLEVSIFIVDVTDLYTFDVDVTYDQSLFTVQSVMEGTLLPSFSGPPCQEPNPDDCLNGTTFLTIPAPPDPFGSTFTIEGSLFGVAKGASTLPNMPGLLALITFSGVLGADPDISLSNIILIDSNGEDIPLTPVPEPATIGLLGLGLLAVARRVRKQRQLRSSDARN